MDGRGSIYRDVEDHLRLPDEPRQDCNRAGATTAVCDIADDRDRHVATQPWCQLHVPIDGAVCATWVCVCVRACVLP
jgi:hypothetical protein